ncbi:endonuclease/exonuclease/phosphatase family protein [Echinicola shivajiensis]|uniref:endonuclease/exonuclease/phosphatase family protein n=1 Tax=Echinicola shivajiensis TaxID=1035916 RepID=UPI001BFC782B|nr:endonuclease/exonuclease/phosphatase family protein [Echinicola shivajiensis]
MKKLIILIILWPTLFLSCGRGKNQELSSIPETVSFRAASYNIRYNPKADVASGNGWEKRKEPLSHLIVQNQFDLVGTQEGDSTQIADLKGLLPGFDYVGYPYGGKTHDLHNCATFYKKDLFTVLDKGVFWFSETPDDPSIGWDATDRRICTWTKFKVNGTEKVFFVFNSHFYWRLKKAKEKSGPLLVEKIKQIAKDNPVIALGDLNSTINTSQIKAIKGLLSDAFEITESPRQGVEGTNLGGGVFQGNAKNRIDYIFVSSAFTVEDYLVISDKYEGNKHPSDHLPVSSRLSF